MRIGNLNLPSFSTGAVFTFGKDSLGHKMKRIFGTPSMKDNLKELGSAIAANPGKTVLVVGGILLLKKGYDWYTTSRDLSNPVERAAFEREVAARS